MCSLDKKTEYSQVLFIQNNVQKQSIVIITEKEDSLK